MSDIDNNFNIVTPWSTVGYLTYKRTYARRLNETDINGPTEEWADTVERVLTASDKQLKVGFTPHERARLQKAQRKTSRDIARQKHDAQKRN